MIKAFDSFYHGLTGFLIGLNGLAALHYYFMRSGPVPLDLSFGLIDGFPVIFPDATTVAAACAVIGVAVAYRWLTNR